MWWHGYRESAPLRRSIPIKARSWQTGLCARILERQGSRSSISIRCSEAFSLMVCAATGILLRVPLVLLSTLAVLACDAQTDDVGSCPDFEPVPATPVGVVDIAGVDLFALESRTLQGDEQQYGVIAEDASVAAGELLLSVTSMATPVSTDSRRSRLTPRLSCIGPPGPSVETNTRLIDLTLTSDARWNESLPAGSALGEVEVVEARSSLSLDVPELPEHLEGLRFGTVLTGASLDAGSGPRLFDYLRDRPLVPLSLLLRFEPPDAERRHRFTVTYRTEDGETFTAISVPVTIAPRPPPLSVDNLAGTAWRLSGYFARAADGALAESPASTDSVSGIEFSVGLSQMVFRFREGQACEFNIRLLDSMLELRGSDPSEAYDPEERDCTRYADRATDEQRFLERFLQNPTYRLKIDSAAALAALAALA